jgi:very-short-patch-repair endonuclease
VIDFCCIESRLVVEIDGGQHSSERDARRTDTIARSVMRVAPKHWNARAFAWSVIGTMRFMRIWRAS